MIVRLVLVAFVLKRLKKKRLVKVFLVSLLYSHIIPLVVVSCLSLG